MRYVQSVLAVLAVSAAGAIPSQAQNADPVPKRDACFFSSQFQGWRAPNDKTIIIRVGINRFYRLDLAASCHTLTAPNAHLINRIRGSDVICRPLDWELMVDTSPGGFAQACIVREMTQMNRDEVAALPAKYRP